jgi:hypothetical protein
MRALALREPKAYDDWLNEDDEDEIKEKAERLGISYLEAEGLRDGAPQEAKDAFEEDVKEETYWMNQSVAVKELEKKWKETGDNKYVEQIEELLNKDGGRPL